MNDRAIPSQPRFDDDGLERLYRRIRRSIETTHASSVGTRARLAIGLVAASVIAAVVLVAASELVYHRLAAGLDVGAHGKLASMLVLALIGALTLAATLVAVWRGRSGLGFGIIALWLLVALATPAYLLLALATPAHVPDPDVALVWISPWGTRCMLIAGIVGVLVLVTFAAALRRAAPAASRLRGAALGAAAGTWAGLVVFMFCPSNELRHVILGHVLPIAALTCLGALSVPRLLRP
ncbi:MAG TPA: NrsF family protein [Casimicrobiaceae bacterium]|jgi:hypothetical protein